MPDDRAPAVNPRRPRDGEGRVPARPDGKSVTNSTDRSGGGADPPTAVAPGATADGVGSANGSNGSNSAARNRRRRGSRGGARNRSGQKEQPSSGVVADQPDLPDLPWEGEPTGAPQLDRVTTNDASVGGTEPETTTTNPEITEAHAVRSARGNQPRRKVVIASAMTKSGAEPTATQSDAGRSKRQKNRGRTQRRTVPSGDYTMCVHVRPHVTQIAVLDGRTLIEHYVSHADDDVAQINGNIYLGRVQNVLPGMEAAFVDIATPKNAVLYRGDVQIDRDVETTEGVDQSALRIENLLRNGQLVVCQVTKNPIGAKGARLTQDVSIAGRFVVLVPNSGTYGISKRLPDDERKRLRGVLDTVKPADHGIIVRTAAAGADADELRRDVTSLVQRWDQISAKAAKLKGPALLHREPNLAVRIIREEFSEAYRRVVIDDERVHEEVRSYVESISPDLAGRIELFDSTQEPLPIFEQFHVHEQLHKAIDRKVWLPSGGSIIIERTEALTVIDVNTGKNVGSTSLEETVFRNNLEAATEIARQLRLRDIGGIIVIDFIDMEIKANRAGVVAHFREELSKDKTRTQVYEISELGLVEMTRKRISEGLLEALSDTCPTCSGRGFVFDPNVLTD